MCASVWLCVRVRVGGQGRGQAGVGPGCPLINSCWASHAGLDGWEGDSSWLGEKVISGTPSLQAGTWRKVEAFGGIGGGLGSHKKGQKGAKSV